MATLKDLLNTNPIGMSEENYAQLLRSLETLNYGQLRQYVLARLKPLVDNVRKHLQEDPVGSIDQVLDFQDAFCTKELIQTVRWNLAQFQVNAKNPRKAPAVRSKEATELSYATDYSFRRIVYPIVADLAKILYLRAEEANVRNPNSLVRYIPLLIMFNQQNAIGYPPRVAFLVTPVVYILVVPTFVFLGLHGAGPKKTKASPTSASACAGPPTRLPHAGARLPTFQQNKKPVNFQKKSRPPPGTAQRGAVHAGRRPRCPWMCVMRSRPVQLPASLVCSLPPGPHDTEVRHTDSPKAESRPALFFFSGRRQSGSANHSDELILI
ncbi:hypothetical protein GL50803_0092663 [Giardia duodenalis]|uniref:Uncharacterized protein n=1 Tax=Giardia intestinalis (strain ATCC 50803 / WB clone C6) TaxID=184922 RepID=A8BF27_GIAIC|nr:hypothetical protein GL50803_0092663 [Giardia intestinalis]KAE8305689.1 hypothetical protein GL50803_0092663 [Giardia intestinalis]|eukprot:XP_001707467.1 Hypothetical protein GL50803_92663 [Giardia lamblia ATCC 50803]